MKAPTEGTVAPRHGAGCRCRAMPVRIFVFAVISAVVMVVIAPIFITAVAMRDQIALDAAVGAVSDAHRIFIAVCIGIAVQIGE